MGRLQTAFVIAFHGCDRSVGERALQGEIGLLQSTRKYDWLGSGAYFWEGDHRRALEWAQGKAARGDYKDPYAIGAVIDLGNCLDLVVRENLELVRSAYDSFADIRRAADLEMPINSKAPKDDSPDLVMRFLDCAVMNHLHVMMEEENLERFDSVRALFGEGHELYEGSGFRDRTHIQIAVRTDSCVKALFRPRD